MLQRNNAYSLDILQKITIAQIPMHNFCIFLGGILTPLTILINQPIFQ